MRAPVARPDLSQGPDQEQGEVERVGPRDAETVSPDASDPILGDVEDRSIGGPEVVPGDDSDLPVGHLAIVIDDLGRSLEDIDRLESLGIPLSYAVLPFESRTEQVVQRLGDSNREILCHLPMEAVHGNNPGPGALVLGMSPRQLAKATRAAVDRIPGAVGVNNHMGSGLTSDRDSMEAILQVLRDEELFFLDSRTSPDTVAFDIARSLNIPTAERQVFLDTDPSVEAIRLQFDRLREIAGQKGAAIAIGHPYPSTLEVLAEEVAKSQALGFDFVPVSFLLERTGLQ
ncbi:MAG: divergent polysaccharide deacetylase family protein [Thermoanaerobaculia bacterium]|nr:divergent polysaccharide deacetylase family protein [Thermoanaerobaculia bacterium]